MSEELQVNYLRGLCLLDFYSASMVFLLVLKVRYPLSTARASVVGQHATRFLSRMGTTYGDAVLKEFDDPLLKEHVDSISLSEAEPASSDRRVVFLCVHVLI